MVLLVKFAVLFQKIWPVQRTLKWRISMKEPEARAGEALRALLERIPILQLEGIDAEAVSGDWELDLIARMLVNGRQHLLVCEYKQNAQPRHARSALLELRNYVAHRAPEATLSLSPHTSHPRWGSCAKKTASAILTWRETPVRRSGYRRCLVELQMPNPP